MLQKPPVGGTVFYLFLRNETEDFRVRMTQDVAKPLISVEPSWSTSSDEKQNIRLEGLSAKSFHPLSLSPRRRRRRFCVGQRKSRPYFFLHQTFFTKLCFCFGKHSFFSLFIVMHIFLQLSWHNFSIFFILPYLSSVLLYKMYIFPHNLCPPCQWTPEIWKVYPLLVALSPLFRKSGPRRHHSSHFIFAGSCKQKAKYAFL